MSTFRYAAAQFYSGDDLDENLRVVTSWAEKAKKAGAHCLVTPENSNLNRSFFRDGKPSKDVAWEKSEAVDGTFVQGCQALAKRLQMFLVVGVDFRGDVKPIVYVGQFLFGPAGDVLYVHKKTVLWDYEYTLFEPGSQELNVTPTPIGRIGLHCCADQIVPDVPRVLALKGAEVFCNSLNSRGPDEARTHIPLRAIENGVWHVSSNTVGNPSNEGLLWPWTGGSQVIAPDGSVLAQCDEETEMMVWADICPARAGRKDGLPHIVPDLFAWRRPELYQLLGEPIANVPAAAMYGPVGPDAAALPSVKWAMMQLSFIHTRKATEWMCARQVQYAARRGAQAGLLPELFCFKRGEVADYPAEAAEYSKHIASALSGHAKEHKIWLATTLVEEEAGKLYHTAYLWEGGTGRVFGTYRKTHLSRREDAWATQGSELSRVFDCGIIGRVAFVTGDEMWVPEVARSLALGGAELLLHPCDWDRREAPHCCATERCSENRTHILSVTRLDNIGKEGSQVAFAGEFDALNGEPIALMRYSQCQWQRYGVEEQLLVDLRRREAHCKMMGHHLDVLATRQPKLYNVIVATGEDCDMIVPPFPGSCAIAGYSKST